MKRKEKMITVMAALTATAALTGLFFIEGNTKKEIMTHAEETQQNTSAGFTMKEGASIRLNVEEGMYGIRFGANVDDTERNYSMMIVPTELTEGYEENKTKGEKLSEYCERIADENGGSVAKAENLKANANGEISCALVQIKWENLNRAFTGIAYYEENNERIEAQRASDGERSVSEVANKAVESEDLTAAEKEAVTRLQEDGKKQACGIAIDAAMGEALFGLTMEENADGEWMYKGTKLVTFGTNSFRADGWKICGKNTIDTILNKDVWQNRLFFEEGTASFVMWSKQTAQAVFYTNDDNPMQEITFQENETKLIVLPSENLTAYTRMKITTMTPDAEGKSEYFIGEITEKTAQAAAAEVSDLITALPSEETLNNAEETAFESYSAQILAAELYYNGLSGLGKTLTNGVEKLSALIKAMEEKQTLRLDWGTNSDLIIKGTHNSWGENVKVVTTEEEGYGKCWKVIREISPAGYDKTEVLINKVSVSSKKTEGFKNIIFYVYTNVVASEATVLEAAVTEGKFSSSSTKMKKTFALENKAWVKITLTREEFLLCTNFTAMFDVAEKGYFLISPFYGEK